LFTVISFSSSSAHLPSESSAHSSAHPKSSAVTMSWPSTSSETTSATRLVSWVLLCFYHSFFPVEKRSFLEEKHLKLWLVHVKSYHSQFLILRLKLSQFTLDPWM
jgi:hypothetical protein